MGLFDRLFGRTKADISTDSVENAKIEDTQWEPIPAYIDANPEEYELVSVIATAIASGDQPDSEFVIKNIQVRNPEARVVSIIAASLAAEYSEDSKLVVRSIQRKK